MGVGRAEDGNLSIRSDHRRRMAQDALQIFFADRVEDARAAAALDNPQRRVGRVIDGDLESAILRHVAETLPSQRWIPFAARELDVLRIPAATLFPDEARRFLLDFRTPRGCLQAF